MQNQTALPTSPFFSFLSCLSLYHLYVVSRAVTTTTPLHTARTSHPSNPYITPVGSQPYPAGQRFLHELQVQLPVTLKPWKLSSYTSLSHSSSYRQSPFERSSVNLMVMVWNPSSIAFDPWKVKKPAGVCMALTWAAQEVRQHEPNSWQAVSECTQRVTLSTVTSQPGFSGLGMVTQSPTVTNWSCLGEQAYSHQKRLRFTPQISQPPLELPKIVSILPQEEVCTKLAIELQHPDWFRQSAQTWSASIWKGVGSSGGFGYLLSFTTKEQPPKAPNGSRVSKIVSSIKAAIQALQYYQRLENIIKCHKWLKSKNKGSKAKICAQKAQYMCLYFEKKL